MTFTNMQAFLHTERSERKRDYNIKKGRAGPHKESKRELVERRQAEHINIESLNKIMRSVERELACRGSRVKAHTLAAPENLGYTIGDLMPASSVQSGFHQVMKEMYHDPIIARKQRKADSYKRSQSRESTPARGALYKATHEKRTIAVGKAAPKNDCNSDFMGL